MQSSHFIEESGGRTMDKVTFCGQEKTATTIRLAKMNLAVHGLEGDIREANTFYEDVHRLPFGLPGVNKGKKVSNGNYLWISYFHSYLGTKGHAGFVMSSQASSAGRGEMDVRRKLVETGDVDVMVSIRSNFFYTRTVYDFSPEQLQNLSTIVWLYRGQSEKFTALVQQYLERTLVEAADIAGCATAFRKTYEALVKPTATFLKSLPKDSPVRELVKERDDAGKSCFASLDAWTARIAKDWKKPCAAKPAAQRKFSGELETLAAACRDLVKDVDLVFKLALRVVDTAEKDADA